MKIPFRYLFFLPVLLAPFLFRDYSPDNELRYISMAEEAWRNRTWFTFYNHGEMYADKPPLYFWLLMLARSSTGSFHMGLIGLFSILPALGIGWLMSRWMREDDPAFDAPTADFLLFTTGFFLGSALVLRMDMLMAFFICLSLYTFFRMYTGRSRPYEKWLLPVFVFAGLFTKGPVGLLVPLISLYVFLAVKKRLRDSRIFFGAAQWGVLLALCIVWLGLVYAEGGWEYLENILFRQTVGRGIRSFHHRQPVYYYFEHMPLTFLPWTILYVAVWAAGLRKRLFATDTERLFAIVTGSTIVFLSLVSSKLDIYLLPVYPFVAYLTVRWMQRLGDTWYVRAGVWIPAVALAVAFPAYFFIAGSVPAEYEIPATVPVALSLASVGGVTAVFLLFRRRVAAAIRSAAAGVLVFLFVFSFALPAWNAYIGLGELARAGEALAGRSGADRYAFYKFRDGESMDMYLGAPLEKLVTLERLEQIRTGPEPVVVFVGYWELRHEPDLRRWLDRQSGVRRVGEYYVLLVGGK